jgi:nitrogen fixation NifU-like protein
MDSLYKEIVLDHYKNPHNFGTLDPADYTAEDSNPLCIERAQAERCPQGGTFPR